MDPEASQVQLVFKEQQDSQDRQDQMDGPETQEILVLLAEVVLPDHLVLLVNLDYLEQLVFLGNRDFKVVLDLKELPDCLDLVVPKELLVSLGDRDLPAVPGQLGRLVLAASRAILVSRVCIFLLNILGKLWK